jgi:hypothetical protein
MMTGNPLMRKNPLKIMHKTKLVGRAMRPMAAMMVMRVEQDGRQNNRADTSQ